MQWSERRQSWCVIPTEHTSWIDITKWCHDQFGRHSIDSKCDGVWSHCDGIYYDLKFRMHEWDFPDTRNYFSFKQKEDANFFILKWGNKS